MHIALITIGASGHVNVTLPFVTELVRRGVRVSYFATENYRKTVEFTGANFIAFESVLHKPGEDIAKDMIAELPLRFLTEADHIITQILPILEQDRPDAIIYDTLALAGRLAIAALGVPAIQVYASYAANDKFSSAKFFPPIPDTHPARAAAKELANDLTQRYGVPHLDIFEIFEGAADFNIVFILRAFQPAGETFDDHFVFTGAQIAPRDNAGTWQAPAGDKPLIYASLGTLFTDWPEFFIMLFAAVKDLPVNLVASIGNSVKIESLGEIPENVTIARYLPQLDILEKADLFVTHAGTGSVMESLSYGVPMIAIPMMPEQGITATRLAELGLGITFHDKSKLSTEVFKSTIQELLGNPAYKAKADFMKEEMKKSGGYKMSAAKAIEYFENKLS